jgi:hypothetical protein
VPESFGAAGADRASLTVVNPRAPAGGSNPWWRTHPALIDPETTMDTTNPLRRAALACAVPLALLAAGCSTPASRPDATTTWTAVTQLAKIDQTTGAFLRQGVALFPDGTAALLTIEGQFAAPGSPRFSTKGTYRFEDGSTLVYQGMNEQYQDAGRTRFKGTGTVVSGTGRYLGATGTVTSTGRALSPTDVVNEFRGQLTTPSR